MTSPLKLCSQNFDIWHKASTGGGGGSKNVVFCSDRIKTLVAMATYTSHILIMEKSGNCKVLLSHWRYLSFIFREMFIE